MTSYFIAGTGTDIGKTLFTCALAYQSRRANRVVAALKPVISGFDLPLPLRGRAGWGVATGSVSATGIPPFLTFPRKGGRDMRQDSRNVYDEENAIAASDTGLLLAAQGLPITPENVRAVSPWRYRAPLSPDMAARDEGRELDFQELVNFCERRCADGDALIESAGGICSPLDARHTMLDWAAALGLPVILVAGSYLGALSHTLTAAHAIVSRGLILRAVVVSESSGSTVPLERTSDSLRRFLPKACLLLPLARLDSRAELWKYAPDMTGYF